MANIFQFHLKPGFLDLPRRPAFHVSRSHVANRVYQGPPLDRVQGDLVFDEDLGTIKISGNVKVNGSLLAGARTGLEVRGDMAVRDDASIGGGLAVIGQVDVRGSVVTGWRFFTTGRCGVRSFLWSGDDIVAQGGLWADRGLFALGKVHTPSSMGSSGHVAVRGNLTCEGTLQSNRFIEVHGNLTVGGNIKSAGPCRIGGNATIGGTFSSRGALLVLKDLDCHGDIAVEQNIQVGWTIRCGRNIAARGRIISGRCIKAGANVSALEIDATDRIFAGLMDERPPQPGEMCVIGSVIHGRIVMGKVVSALDARTAA